MKTECESRELRRHEGSAVVKVVESERVAVGERGRVGSQEGLFFPPLPVFVLPEKGTHA